LFAYSNSYWPENHHKPKIASNVLQTSEQLTSLFAVYLSLVFTKYFGQRSKIVILIIVHRLLLPVNGISNRRI